jgi:hypothetical protein
MRRIGYRRPSPSMMVASVALLVALGGTSYAAIQLPANSVGTKQLKKNAVISKKVKNRSLKAIDFALGQLPRGPQGPAGAQGPQGPAGPAGATNVTVRQGPGVSSGTDTASCNPGERAVGGGGVAESADGVLWLSAPTQTSGTPTSWDAAAIGSAGDDVTAYVVCAAP